MFSWFSWASSSMFSICSHLSLPIIPYPGLVVTFAVLPYY